MTRVVTSRSVPTRSTSPRRETLRTAVLALGLVALVGCGAEVSGIASGAGAGPAGTVTTADPASAQVSAPSPPRTIRSTATPGTTTPEPASDPTTAKPRESVAQPSGTAGTPAVPAAAVDLRWLKPGARASYYFGTVSSAAHRYTWTEDPGGDYTDPKTGKRYSSDKGLAPASQAAEGVMHFDVLSVGDDGVAFGRTSALLDRSTNVFTPVPNAEAAVAAGQVGQIWIAPEALTAMLGTGNDQNQVLVGPITFEGKQVQAVVFVNNSTTNYSFHAYDPSTGLLLQADTSVASTESPDGSSPPSTNTRTHLELSSLRQRTVPGFGTALPDWIGQGQGLTYGVKYLLMDSSSGQPMAGPPLEYSEQILFQRGGTQWANYSLTRTLNGQVENGTGFVTGAGPYLMDPTALATMKAGAVLDTDPLTSEKLAVEQVDEQRVVISITSTGNQWLGVYDKQSGALVQTELKTSLAFVQTQLQQG